MECSQVHWIAGVAPSSDIALTCKIRYRQHDQACRIEQITPDKLHVTFTDPQRAITPGQSIVFYHGDVCLGGAIIEQALQEPVLQEHTA